MGGDTEVEVERVADGGGEDDAVVLDAPRYISQCNEGTLVVLEEMDEQLVLAASWERRPSEISAPAACGVPA